MVCFRKRGGISGRSSRLTEQRRYGLGTSKQGLSEKKLKKFPELGLHLEIVALGQWL